MNKAVHATVGCSGAWRGLIHRVYQRQQNGLSGCLHFLQVAIPSYLLALAVGDLESRRIGPLSHIWWDSKGTAARNLTKLIAA